MISAEQRLAFLSARAEVIGTDVSDGGIGTLSEKALHKMLKLYIEPRCDKHEIKILGSVADILNENGITEIQTRSLEKLISKLSKFLPQYKTTVILPLAAQKTVRWLNPETGEISPPKKSPKHENAFTAMYELYKLRKLATHENLSVRLIFITAEDYRYLDGWDKTGKRGSTRMERIPLELIDDITLTKGEDYISLIPKELPEQFTVKELARAGKFSPRISSYVTGFLREVGAIEHIGREGRAYLYRIARKP